MTQTTEPPQEVIQKARDRLVALTKQHEADWGLGHESYCHIDSAAQELVWVFEIETETPEDPDVPQDKPDAPETENHAGEFPQPRGAVREVRAPLQFIGTWNYKDESFLWSWENPSIPEALQDHAHKVKAFGTEHGIDSLTKAKIMPCSEEGAWRLTALAAYLAEAQGGYCAVSPGPLVFLTFGTPRIV